MTRQLTLKPIIKDMLERAGIEDVYDFAPSAKDCACPIVIANETYERTDLLDDCEYGTVKLGVIAVRETMDEVMSAISGIVYALHRADWNRYNSNQLEIRSLSVLGLPERETADTSGRQRAKTCLILDVRLEQRE